MRVEVTYVDGRDEAAVAAALPGAKLFYMESPTSWVMEAHDVGALAALAKAHGILTIIDNSWATPVFQQPLSLGVDMVVHSASKYLGGHSDVVAGVVAGSKELIGRIRARGLSLSRRQAVALRRLAADPRPAHAAGPHARARGVRPRDRAARLQDHPIVEKVCHPGLANRLPAGLNGTSGLFSFDLSRRRRHPRLLPTA